MRITRESLIQTAKQYVAQYLRRNRQIISIYLAGSLLSDEPLLGGTTDIDLFFIHDSDPIKKREMVELSDEVHLDIAHFSQSLFRQPRMLRVDPWIAPFICLNPICLHDTQHWLEFTQSSVCTQYERPDYVLERARTFSTQARQMWMSLKIGMVEGEKQRALTFLQSLERAANAILTLNGKPLTERRLLVHFPQRTEALGCPGMAAGFVDIIMPQPVPDKTWETWMVDWEAAFRHAGEVEESPARLHPCRVTYYKNAARGLRGTNPAAALWTILHTWTLAISLLPDDSEHLPRWQSAQQTLGLGVENEPESIRSLDAYLDNVEETLDRWADKMGVVTTL